MVREIIQHASRFPGIRWGQYLPLTETQEQVRKGPDIACKVHFVFDEHNATGSRMHKSLDQSFTRLNDRFAYPAGRQVSCTDGSAEEAVVKQATHVVIVLTDLLEPRRWLADGMPAQQHLSVALAQKLQQNRFILVYDKPKGLDSAVFGQVEQGVDTMSIRELIWNHEALIYRSPDCEYER